jgi:type III pantothenate kinase
MLLALDLGNTSLTVGLFDHDKLATQSSIPVAAFGELDGRLRAVPGERASAVDRVALASVNPPWVRAVQASVETALPRATLVILGCDLPVPVRAEVDHPQEVGVDRLLNVLAAWRLVKQPCLVVDFGSALTIDVISKTGSYLGGVIAPGVGMSAHALHSATALLPEVTPEAVERVTGRDTITCIRSGLFFGTIAMVEGLVARLRAEHPDARTVLATGGGAALFTGHIDVIDEFVPGLTLEGIRLAVEEGER